MNNISMLNETLEVCQQGYYYKDGEKKELQLCVNEMMEAQVYLPDEVEAFSHFTDFKHTLCLGRRCIFDCVNMDSFASAREINKQSMLEKSDERVLVLNLANPVNIGGGVRGGARAQEEDLCRKSSLLLSLESEKAFRYYKYNRTLHTYMGSDAIIITPNVEIIRDENGELLDETVVVSVMTCAAPMVKFGFEGMSEEEYKALVYKRIVGMLNCAAAHGYKYLVLGAFGCGAFGNDSKIVSDLFFKAFKEFKFDGMRTSDMFRRVTFAVLSHTPQQYNFKQFYRNFGENNYYKAEDDEVIRKVLEDIKATEVNLDKIKGCLVGGAVGDALGYPVEFMRDYSIFEKYGSDGITEYELSKNGLALISDDTQITLFTAVAILFSDTRRCLRGIPNQLSGIAERAYNDWLVTQNVDYTYYSNHKKEVAPRKVSWLLNVPEMFARRAPGNTCLSALSALQKKDEVIYDYTKIHLNSSKGCGGVMRVAPLGLVNTNFNMECVDNEGAQFAAITHSHSLGYMPAAVLVHIINRIVFGSGSLLDIVKEARDTVSRMYSDDENIGCLCDIINLAISLSENDKTDLENIKQLGEGWVAEEALAIAIYCSLRHQNDFSAGVIAAVNHSGDSDSTGAITGNILGALLGFSAIDDKWKKNLELYDIIVEISEDLCHGCHMSEYGLYEDEDWLKKYCYIDYKC